MASYFDASAASGSSPSLTAIGTWTKKSESAPIPLGAVEVVAWTETSSPNFSLPTYSSLHNEQRATPNGSDELFGPTTAEVQRPLSVVTVSVLPPYSPGGEKQPESSSNEEPLTLARMLFKYGFLFFPFWLAGIYILCSPLLPTPDWEAGKTEAEKIQLLYLLRKTELKWARRCLLAFFTLIVTVFLLALVIQYGIVRAI